MSSAIVIRPVTLTPVRVGRAGLVAAAVVVGWLQATACGTAAEPPAVLLETTAGETVTGGLLAITADEVRLEVDAQPRVWPVKEIRRLFRRIAKSRGPYALTVTLVGGQVATHDFDHRPACRPRLPDPAEAQHLATFHRDGFAVEHDGDRVGPHLRDRALHELERVPLLGRAGDDDEV